VRLAPAATLLAAALCAVPAFGARAAEPDASAAEQPVIGVSFRGVHRAYPLTLFSTRKVLNDEIARMEVAVYHDPEQGVSTAWFRTVLGEPIEFSGAAADAVADDLTTITRWDMTTGLAVSGNLEGQQLVQLPVTTTSWAGWAATHPNASAFGEQP
jgi:hypothetical protein